MINLLLSPGSSINGYLAYDPYIGKKYKNAAWLGG